MCQPTNPTSTLSQTQQGRPSPVAFCQLRCNTSGDAELTDRKVGNGAVAIDVNVTEGGFLHGWQTNFPEKRTLPIVEWLLRSPTVPNIPQTHGKLDMHMSCGFDLEVSFANFMFQTWRSKKARCYSRKTYIQIPRQPQIQGYTKSILV